MSASYLKQEAHLCFVSSWILGKREGANRR